MISHTLSRLAALLGMISVFPWSPASAVEPLRAHPSNPYILEFRGKPTLLKNYGASYDWMFDSSLNYTSYLNVLQRDGMNLVRVWCFAFPISNAANMIQPWPRSNANGKALDGLGKWDFSAWDTAYFDRLKSFAQAASDRGMVVEFTLFSVFYADGDWMAGPFHPSNNMQGYGPTNRFDSLRPTDTNLFNVQRAAVRKIVRELNGFDNIYFEVQNEPFWNEAGVKDSQEVSFQNTILADIRAEEASLPNRHLVAHNFPQQMTSMSSDFDILNEHYPIAVPAATIPGAEALLANHYSRGKILSLDETNTTTALQTRLEAWMFFIGGGAIYDGLDDEELVYSTSNPSGDNALGRNIRAAVKNAGTYMDGLNLVSLRRNLSWVTGGIPSGAKLQASAYPGKQYVAYLHHGSTTAGQSFQLHYDPIDTGNKTVSLRVSLDAGNWKAVWTRPSDLAVISTQNFTHTGGNITLAQVSYQSDVALRIDRDDVAISVPPTAPTGLRVQP